MEKQKKRGGFWYMIGPLLLFWVIEWIGSALISIVISFTLAGPKLAGIIAEYGDAGTLANTQIQAIKSQISTIMTDILPETTEIILSHSAEFTALLGLITLPFMLMFFFKDRKREKIEHQISNESVSMIHYVSVIGLGVTACIAMNNLENLCLLAFRLTDSYAGTAEGYYSSAFPIQIICLGVIVPIVEEMLYRGVLFQRYREKGSFFIAALYSSLLFSVAHSNMVQMIFAMAVGLLMAYVYEKYESVKAPICLHIVINITSLVVTKLDGFTWMFGDMLRLAFVTVGCVFLGSVFFVMIQRMRQEPENLSE